MSLGILSLVHGSNIPNGRYIVKRNFPFYS
jgi:hypothetical protein